jgi:hypothetical protein
LSFSEIITLLPPLILLAILVRRHQEKSEISGKNGKLYTKAVSKSDDDHLSDLPSAGEIFYPSIYWGILMEHRFLAPHFGYC